MNKNEKKMEKIILIGFIFLASIRINGYAQESTRQQSKAKADTVVKDTLEYSLYIDDPDFESWLALQQPRNFYSQSYYETKNQFYVIEWNRRYMDSLHYGGLYETYIDYTQGTNYGLDLNYKLYYFFKYFEEKHHVNLLPTGRDW